MPIAIRPADISDAPAISRLVRGLSSYFLADPASDSGQPFLSTLTPEAMAQRIAAANFRCHVAETAGELSGYAAVRDDSHLYHLFVAQHAHGKGIARALWRHVLAQAGGRAFTVNASLHAVPVYERFGFVATEAPRTADGVIFVPMRYPGRSAETSLTPAAAPD